MNRIAPIITLALLSGACSSTKSGHYGAEQEFNANCRVQENKISIEIQTNGQPLSELGLVLQDGTVLRPDVVRGPRGKNVSLDTQEQPTKLMVSFPNSAGTSGPRQLTLTTTSGDNTSILLADIKSQSIDSRFAAFGYTREQRTFPDGSKETMYIRVASDGERHEVSRDTFENEISTSIKRIYSSLPETAEEIADTPGVTHFLANLFEQGCQYAGDGMGTENTSLPSSGEFSSKPVRVIHYNDQGQEVKDEDPLSTVTRLLVQAINSTHAEELHDLHERVRNGECDEALFVHTEASFKARALKQAMDIIRDNLEGLSASDWKDKKYGHYFTLYLGWVEEAESGSESDEATVTNLTRLILRSLTRKGLRPDAKPIAYRLKLQRQYSALTSEFSE